MTIPQGVTVRQIGEPLAPRNFLHEVAEQADRAKAIQMLRDKLGITSELCDLYFSDAKRWAQISPFSRLMDVAKALHAECYEAMDLVSAEDPIDVVGTRD